MLASLEQESEDEENAGAERQYSHHITRIVQGWAPGLSLQGDSSAGHG
jgi:hypothetical protein